MADWKDAFEEHEATIRKVAQAERTPLAEDMKQLIKEYEAEQ